VARRVSPQRGSDGRLTRARRSLSPRPTPEIREEGEAPARGVSVRELLRPEARLLQLRLLAGRRGLTGTVNLARVQRPGLALAGYNQYVRYGRVQIVGGSELDYLAGLSAGRRKAAIGRLMSCKLSCCIITKGMNAPEELIRQAQARAVPLLATRLDSNSFIKRLTAFLDDRLAPHTELHGVLVDVSGLGVLMLGESGIGKSECALDLVDRGHRLVADDVVIVKRLGDLLLGSAPRLTRNHMEVRGLGVIDIKDLYGVSSLRALKRIQLVVQLERWEPGRDYDRLGLGGERHGILGVDLPLLRMPVAPGRNISILLEVASRNQLLREGGYHAARRLARRVDARLG
jgi:HPr kinase/phosphorylase